MGAGLQTKKPANRAGFSGQMARATQSATPLTIFGGGTGIRTLDRLLTYAGFQDQCIQPLCHPSNSRFDATTTIWGGSITPREDR